VSQETFYGYQEMGEKDLLKLQTISELTTKAEKE
jgi:hypothetical protein